MKGGWWGEPTVEAILISKQKTCLTQEFVRSSRGSRYEDVNVRAHSDTSKVSEHKDLVQLHVPCSQHG